MSRQASPPERRTVRSRRRPRRVWLAALLLAGAALALVFLPLRRWLLVALEHIRSAGTVGIFAYVGLYSLASAALLPASVLTLAAGFAWGPLLGTAIVWVAANLASALCFWLSRSLAGDWAARRVGDRRLLRAIDRAISRDGLRIVLLLRLSPVVPFNLLNYALGLTQVRSRDYLLGGAIGMLPGTALYVYLGSLISSLSQADAGAPAGGGAARSVLYWGGLGATILVSVLLTRTARKELRRELDSDETEQRTQNPEDTNPKQTSELTQNPEDTG